MADYGKVPEGKEHDVSVSQIAAGTPNPRGNVLYDQISMLAHQLTMRLRLTRMLHEVTLVVKETYKNDFEQVVNNIRCAFYEDTAYGQLAEKKNWRLLCVYLRINPNNTPSMLNRAATLQELLLPSLPQPRPAASKSAKKRDDKKKGK